MWSNDSLSQAKQALRESALHPLRALEVEWAGDYLIISGKVTSFYHKQMAQEIVRAVCRDIELRNTVDVMQRGAATKHDGLNSQIECKPVKGFARYGP